MAKFCLADWYWWRSKLISFNRWIISLYIYICFCSRISKHKELAKWILLHGLNESVLCLDVLFTQWEFNFLPNVISPEGLCACVFRKLTGLFHLLLYHLLCFATLCRYKMAQRHLPEVILYILSQMVIAVFTVCVCVCDVTGWMLCVYFTYYI